MVSKSVKVLFNGIDAVMVLTLIILKWRALRNLGTPRSAPLFLCSSDWVLAMGSLGQGWAPLRAAAADGPASA